MDEHEQLRAIAAVRAWQGDGRVHPLTCGEDSSHRRLEPVAEAEIVVLKCLDCGYRQDWIPKIVFRAFRG
jgi:hypothetical protein